MSSASNKNANKPQDSTERNLVLMSTHTHSVQHTQVYPVLHALDFRG